MEEKIFCAVRRHYVARTPEEIVRQRLLSHLFLCCGFPPHLTCVEVALQSFCPKGLEKSAPNRRIDIVCFQKKETELSPLLLIECKKSFPKNAAFSQLVGYNFFIKASCVALAWEESIFIQSAGELLYEGPIGAMPTYQSLTKP